MAWRNCEASLTFLAALNARYPDRSTASDGTIGDAAHATRESDHNPWVIVDGIGVVRARDVTAKGVDAAWIVEQVRLLGAAGDPRFADGGYAIFNRRITKPDFSGWSVYTGTNPHDKHFHLSWSRNRAGFDSTAPWPFLALPALTTQEPDVAFHSLVPGQHMTIPRPRTGKVFVDFAFDQQGLPAVDAGRQQVRAAIHSTKGGWRALGTPGKPDPYQFWQPTEKVGGFEMAAGDDLAVIRNLHPAWNLGVTITHLV